MGQDWLEFNMYQGRGTVNKFNNVQDYLEFCDTLGDKRSNVVNFVHTVVVFENDPVHLKIDFPSQNYEFPYWEAGGSAKCSSDDNGIVTVIECNARFELPNDVFQENLGRTHTHFFAECHQCYYVELESIFTHHHHGYSDHFIFGDVLYVD